MTEQKSESEKKRDYEKLLAWLKETIPDEWDKYDLKAKFDSTLSYVENKRAVYDDIKTMVKDLKTQVKEVMAQQEKLEHERRQQAEAEAVEYNKRVYADAKEIDQYYARIIRGVNKLCQGFSNLLFIKGRGAIGKSYQIRKALLLNKAEFVEICGDITEAYLYRLLFENNGKIIWFKDVVKLLEGLNSMNLLKSATETEDMRLLTKNNYSKEQDDLPDRFICRCKFVFDYNNLFGIGLKDDFEALVSRGDYVELPFSNIEIEHIMHLIAKEDWQKEVTEFLIKNFRSNGLVRLNLRTQWKAFKTYMWAKLNNTDWMPELKQELNNVSRVRGMLYTLIGAKIVKTTELKQLLLRHEVLNTLRSADNKVKEWLYTEELFQVSEGDRDFLVCINDVRKEVDNRINQALAPPIRV